jgi:hypothetical protein
MPVKSKAQSRYLNATKGHKWVKAHHYDQSTKGLPQHVGKKRRAKGKKKRGK